MISRRGFFGLLGGALAAEAARKIYVLPPLGGWRCAGGVITPGETLFYLSPENWSYRNTITGHVSEAIPEIVRLIHTFAYPEMDVMDIYRQLDKVDIHYCQTILGVKG
jgi:hypothetical protein